METQAVYHHLTPQTYMRAWKHGNSSVYVVKKGTEGVGETKSTKKFAGISDYHSLRAGFPYHTEEDCKKFFKPLENYTVKIDKELLSSSKEMNEKFYDFDKWIIMDNNGDIVSQLDKKELKKKILSIHVKDIEVEWSKKYENDWNSINEAISNEVFSNINAQSISAIKRDELIKFMVSLEWRTKPYHPVLQESLDLAMGEKIWGVDFKTIILPEDEQLYPFLKTIYDEYAHAFILKLYRKFLYDEKGHIMNEASDRINQFCVELLIAPSNGEFITSDNPVCRFTDKWGTLSIFPLNPKIACRLSKGGTQTAYPLRKLTKEELIHYNNKLKENCNEGYILRDQNRALYFSK